jgi:hypothetical protein
MPEITNDVRVVWGDAAPLTNDVRVVWGDAGWLQTIGSPYTPPAGGSATAGEPNTTPGIDLSTDTGNSNSITHAIEVRDLRDGSLVPVISGTLALADGSTLWTLQCAAPVEAGAQLRAGEQPASVSVKIHSQVWHFLVEDIGVDESFAQRPATFSGRSVVAVADAPYQPVDDWSPDAPTTVAQICDIAQTYTGATIEWGPEDGAVPAGAFTLTGTPWAVVTQLAAAIDGVVEPALADVRAKVVSRYPVMPQEWAQTAPDWQIPWRKVRRSRSTVADVYDYNGLVVVGSQDGNFVLATLDGTSGAVQAPMITDERLTDIPLLTERAKATLGASGKQRREEITLQVPPEGVVMRSQLVRVTGQEATPWAGMVRGVSVAFRLGQAEQTLTIERRMGFQEGSALPQPVPTAPNYENTILLLTGRDLVDYSPLANTITNSGVTVDASMPLFGEPTLRFGGSAFLTVPHKAGFTFGPTFTVEFFARFERKTANITGSSTTEETLHGILAKRRPDSTEPGSWTVDMVGQDGGSLSDSHLVLLRDLSSLPVTSFTAWTQRDPPDSGQPGPFGAWVFVQYTVSSNAVNAGSGGVSASTGTLTNSLANTRDLHIGRHGTNGAGGPGVGFLKGWIGGLAIYNGVARPLANRTGRFTERG